MITFCYQFIIYSIGIGGEFTRTFFASEIENDPKTAKNEYLLWFLGSWIVQMGFLRSYVVYFGILGVNYDKNHTFRPILDILPDFGNLKIPGTLAI